MNISTIVRVLLTGCVTALSMMALAQSSANFKSPAFSVNAGVGDMASSNFRTRASVGQPFNAAALSSAGFTTTSGLFAIPASTTTTGNLPVFNTGVAADRTLLPGGSVDPHYTLISSAEPSLPGPDAIVTTSIATGYWIAQGPDSKWIAPSANQSYPGPVPCNAAGTYTYRTTVDLTGFDPATAVIQGKWAVDNQGTAIRLNGVTVSSTNPGYNPFAAFTISSGFIAGPNTLDFVTSDSGCPNGLRVELAGTATATTGGALAPTITSAAPPHGSLGNAYSHTFTATGIPATMTWSNTSGLLPAGITLDANTGVLSGTPTEAGNFSLVIHAANGVAPDATQIYALIIDSATFGPSTTTLTFAVQTPATTSAAKTLTITNTGSAPMTISAPSMSGPFALGANNCTSLAPAAACTMQITFTPTAPGAATGALTIPTNATASPHVIALAGTGAGVVASGALAYVTNQNSDNVSVIDTATNMVIAIVPVGTEPYGVAVNPAGTRAYVANAGSDNVSVIDTTSFAVIATVAAGDSPYKIAVNAAGTRAYVTNQSGASVSVIDTASNNVESTAAVGSGPVGVAVTSNDSFFYVTTGNSVAMYSTPGNALLTTITLGTAGPWDIAMHPNGATFYVPNVFTHNVSVVNTGTNTVVTTVPTGNTPVDIAVNSDGTRAYVANAGNSTVSVIDTATNNVIASVPVGSQPYGIGVNATGAYTYTANVASNNVSVIDNATNTVVATIGVGNFPRGIAVGPAPVPGAPSATYAPAGGLNFGNVPVASMSAAQTVTFTNTSAVTFTVSGISFNGGGAGFNVLPSSQCLVQSSLAPGASCTFEITVTPGAPGAAADTVRVVTTPANAATPSNVSLQVNGVVATAGGPFAYITNQGSNNVSVIDLPTDTVVATIPVGSQPYGVAVNPAGTRVYITNQLSNNVNVIDTSGNTVIATIPVGTYPNGVVVSPDGTRVYVANSSNSVSVINAATNAVINTIAAGTTPVGIAINPAGTRLYVANNNSNNLSVIDTTNNSLVINVGVGSGPMGVAINAAGTRVYVANSAGGFSIIDTSNNFALAHIGIGGSPVGIAVSPDGARLYMADASGTNGSVKVIDPVNYTLVTSITVGRLPVGISVNAAGTRAYVANRNDNNVSVIDIATASVIASVPVGSQPNAFGLFIALPPPAVTVPGAPTIGTAIAGDGQATISFTAPASNGGSPITSYLASCGTPAITAGGAASPIVVTGLSNGTTYSCTVKAINAIGQGLASAGVSVTPVAAAAPLFSPSATAFTFASQAVATTSAAQTLTITNSGTAALTIAAPAVTGPFAISANTCTSVAPAGACTIALTFTPIAAGAVTGTLNLATNATGSPHAISLSGAGAATGPSLAYITNESSGTVSVINIATNAIVATIPVGNSPYGVAVVPDGTRVYVTNGGANSVSVIDTATNTVTATVPVGSIPQGIAVNPAGSRIYVANGSSNTVSVIDTASNTVIATLPGFFAAAGVAVNPAGTRVYVTGGGSVRAIDTATNTVAATLNTGVGNINGVTVNPAGTLVYVAHSGNDDINVLDAATLAEVNIIDLASGGPTGIALNPAGTRLYVTKYGGGKVTVIDTATRAIIADIPVGTQPIGVAVSPDGARAYVAVNFPGSVAVIDTATNAVIDNMVVGNGAAAFGKFIATLPGAATGPVQLTEVVSRKTHGSHGTYELSLDRAQTVTGNVTVEPRIMGAGHEIVFKFDAPVTNAGTLAVSDSAGAIINGASAVASGNEIVVTLSGNLFAKRVAISLTGINGSVNASVALGFLLGDANNSRSVNAQDTTRIKARTGQIANATNFVYDISVSGRITAVDVIVSKVLNGSTLP